MSVSLRTSNKNIIKTEQGKTYQKASFLRTSIAVATGYIASQVIKDSVMLSLVPLKKNSCFFSVTPEVINSVLKNTELDKKNVSILDTSIPEVAKSLLSLKKKKLIDKFLDKIPIYNKIRGKQFERKILKYIKGENAAFSPRANKILINLKSPKVSMIFHEIGHAMNTHFSLLGKNLQKSRMWAKKFFPVICAVALFKRKKVEGEKTNGIFDKVTTFIKNNCGKLTLLASVPMLLEEGMASIKGQKIASSVLSPDKLKILKNLHGKAWLTYATGTLGLTLGTLLASKTRDFLSKSKEIDFTK